MTEATRLDTLDDVSALLDRKGVPGLSLAYASGDSPVVTRTWGVTSVDGQAPVTQDTIFLAGSVSKVATALAALRLAEGSGLDIDADVNSILTSWRLPPVWGWQPAVTIRMLLAHVSGVSSGWGEGYACSGPVPSLLDDLEGRGNTLPIRQEMLPGLVWFYSSGGYMIVAQVICDVTGLAFPDAMAELVFEPLGMSSSTFAVPLPDRWHAVAARGHSDGKVVPGGWRYSADLGSAGMWTTPTDLMRLARAVNAGTAPEMLQGHPVEPRMGLGPMLSAKNGVTWWSHDGSSTGFECWLAGVPGDTNRFAVAVMTNADGWHGADAEVLQLVSEHYGPGRAGLANLFGKMVDELGRLAADQEQLVGEYVLPTGDLVAVTAPIGRYGPELHLTLPGQRPVWLLATTPLRWRILGIGTDLEFAPPDELRITQYGREVRAVRAR